MRWYKEKCTEWQFRIFFIHSLQTYSINQYSTDLKQCIPLPPPPTSEGLAVRARQYLHSTLRWSLGSQALNGWGMWPGKQSWHRPGPRAPLKVKSHLSRNAPHKEQLSTGAPLYLLKTKSIKTQPVIACVHVRASERKGRAGKKDKPQLSKWPL